jgi:SAM-dependent methyltransferase
MHAETLVRDTFETPKAPEFELDVALWLDRLDENLHYGRAWHRYLYAYRAGGPGGLRILDAASNGGRAALEAAKLNPGATVIGTGSSAETLDLEHVCVEHAGLRQAVDFRTHDPAEPVPDAWGQFDLIVCRGGLARAVDPARVLANLTKSLDRAGLIYLTLPSQTAQVSARLLREAIDVLCPTPSGGDSDPTFEERVAVGCHLVQSLRVDHPIRARIAETQHGDNLEQFVTECLAKAL